MTAPAGIVGRARGQRLYQGPLRPNAGLRRSGRAPSRCIFSGGTPCTCTAPLPHGRWRRSTALGMPVRTPCTCTTPPHRQPRPPMASGISVRTPCTCTAPRPQRSGLPPGPGNSVRTLRTCTTPLPHGRWWPPTTSSVSVRTPCTCTAPSVRLSRPPSAREISARTLCTCTATLGFAAKSPDRAVIRDPANRRGPPGGSGEGQLGDRLQRTRAIFLALSGEVLGGRPEPFPGRPFGPTRGPAMTERGRSPVPGCGVSARTSCTCQDPMHLYSGGVRPNRNSLKSRKSATTPYARSSACPTPPHRPGGVTRAPPRANCSPP